MRHVPERDRSGIYPLPLVPESCYFFGYELLVLRTRVQPPDGCYGPVEIVERLVGFRQIQDRLPAALAAAGLRHSLEISGGIVVLMLDLVDAAYSQGYLVQQVSTDARFLEALKFPQGAV